jgi:hypothetical protein
MTAATGKIDTYLRRVRTGLRGLPDPEVTDIVNELRTHIVERLESASGPRDVAIESVLESFGRPEQIAALYVAESLASRAESSRTPWTILRSLFYWSTLSIIGFFVFMICVVGYSFGVCFFLAALMKPIHPNGVGLWYRNDPANFSLHVGGFSGPAGQERELLGWWLVPVGCSLGGGTILLTTHFALWSLRRLRQPRL